MSINTLGVTLAPDGNNAKAIVELRQKSQKWKDLVDTGHLKGSDVFLALHSTIYKSLQYPLPALTLTEKECRWIASPMLSAGLSGSRINRNFPRDVLFGPIFDGGVGMWNLYDYQCISHISFLTEHINEDNISGELIRCSIEAALVEVGIGRNLFKLDFNLYQALLTDCWIKHIWKYAYDNSIIIKENLT